MLIYKGKNIEKNRKRNYFAQMIKSCYWILVTEEEVGGGGEFSKVTSIGALWYLLSKTPLRGKRKAKAQFFKRWSYEST